MSAAGTTVPFGMALDLGDLISVLAAATVGGVGATLLQQHVEEDPAEFDEENNEPLHAVEGLVWEVDLGGPRPLAVLFLDGRSILSTSGLLRADELHGLIDWLRSGEAGRTLIVRE